MSKWLVWKLFLDVRWPLLVAMLLLCGFECLWAKVTQRIIEELLPAITPFIGLMDLRQVLFQGSGKLLQTFMGGETIHFERVLDLLSVGYVHPLVITIFCIWAIGRAAGAISGELDRGTIELLLAQPVARWRVVVAHLCVDGITIPLLSLSLWLGNWLGTWLTGMLQLGGATAGSSTQVDPRVFGPALINVAALLIAVSGYTMWLSARGRFRGPVPGWSHRSTTSSTIKTGLWYPTPSWIGLFIRRPAGSPTPRSAWPGCTSSIKPPDRSCWPARPPRSNCPQLLWD